MGLGPGTAREMQGQLLLFGAQDIDGEWAPGKLVVGFGVAGDADEDQRRFHGHRGEGIDGNAMPLGDAVERHDGNACGEAAQAAAEMMCPRPRGAAEGSRLRILAGLGNHR